MIETRMLVRVLEADYRGGHSVWLRFDDGLSGVVDLSDVLGGEVFEPLKDPSYFSEFTVDETLVWPNGADFAPEFLHERAKAGPSRQNPDGSGGEPLLPG